MARIVVERIQLPISKTPGEKPPAGLLDGELWINEADRMLYAGVTGGTPTPLDGTDVGKIRLELDGLVNVTTAVATVSAASQGGFLVRDNSVADESTAGAYKVTETIDCGEY